MKCSSLGLKKSTFPSNAPVFTNTNLGYPINHRQRRGQYLSCNSIQSTPTVLTKPSLNICTRLSRCDIHLRLPFRQFEIIQRKCRIRRKRRSRSLLSTTPPIRIPFDSGDSGTACRIGSLPQARIVWIDIGRKLCGSFRWG
jgi:hypothetical protein